jgi:hypothetical protein
MESGAGDLARRQDEGNRTHIPAPKCRPGKVRKDRIGNKDADGKMYLQG